MEKLKLGVIGAGHIFWFSHQKNLAQMDGVEVVAVCDPSEESRKRAEDEIGASTFEDLDSMIAAGVEIDALLNFSPPFVRKAAIETAIKLNVPIFVEKPAAGSVKEAREILALIEASPVPVSVGFMFRYMPAVNRFLELLEGKKIIHVNSEFFCPAITQWGMPDWFLKKEISGGPVLDQAIHLLDLLRFLVGEIESVISFEANVIREKDEGCTIEDSSSTILKFANGATGSHIHSWVHDIYSGSITIRTEHDRITLDLVENTLSGQIGEDTISFAPSEEDAEKNDHFREVAAFLEAVRDGDFSRVRSGYADATQSLLIAESINNTMVGGEIINIKEVS